ncbi:MAG TPA: hypothetical protein PKC25_17285 [Candidatus Rifleibacterium sp.]|nr:hypothetical protein [Candidatus Rifleibacterium sp.]
MLKLQFFFRFNIPRRNRLAGAQRCMPYCEGSLAVASQHQPGQRLVVSRAASRTWWETGWQLQR